ncbi:MAG: hypothetical protein ACTSQU_07935 [Promethearchaeota archaeon]
MSDLIPIQEVIEINPRVQELGEQGFIIAYRIEVIGKEKEY